MTLRRPALLALTVALLGSAPAFAAGRHATENFDTTAPTQELAKTFGDAAETFRRTKALEWLGQEMPRWPQRCPLSVVVKPDETGGDTTFSFDMYEPVVRKQSMRVFGDVQSMLHSVLPHEVTHTVFAHHFGQSVPRWADEGGAVLSENDDERYKHDVKCRVLLNQGQAFTFGRLFAMKEYPRDQHTLYAQGYSICQYLVDKGGKRRLLEFVKVGMQKNNRNWDKAAELYGFDSADDMQVDWMKTLSSTYPKKVARGSGPATTPTSAALTSRGGPETRTSPSAVLSLEPPVVARGVAPATERTASAAPTPSVPPPVRLLPPEMPRR